MIQIDESNNKLEIEKPARYDTDKGGRRADEWWQNYSSTLTPINAANLNALEDLMEKAYGYLIQIVEKLSALQGEIKTLDTAVKANFNNIDNLSKKIGEIPGSYQSLIEYAEGTFAKRSDINNLSQQIDSLESRVYYLENSNQGSSLDITSITFFNGGLSDDVGREYVELNGGDAEDFSTYYIIDSNGVY